MKSKQQKTGRKVSDVLKVAEVRVKCLIDKLLFCLFIRRSLEFIRHKSGVCSSGLLFRSLNPCSPTAVEQLASSKRPHCLLTVLPTVLQESRKQAQPSLGLKDFALSKGGLGFQQDRFAN